VFLPVGLDFYDGIANGSLEVQILKTASATGNSDDFINGVNLQIDATQLAATPEPTSMLLGGTGLAVLAAAVRRYRRRQTV
jgi:MYXO-CTERM domain-containing protein